MACPALPCNAWPRGACAGHGDDHRRITRDQRADAVHDGRAAARPARLDVLPDGRHRPFGHRRVGLVAQRADPSAAVVHRASEGDQAPTLGSADGLDHLLEGQRPLGQAEAARAAGDGGTSATSAPSGTSASSGRNSWFTATRRCGTSERSPG